MAKQTVYARYVSKDALFFAVVESLRGPMLSVVSAPASPHPHCLYDPSFRPARGKIERQIKARVDCFMAQYGAAETSPA